MTDYWLCQKCGTKNIGTQIFCQKCGSIIKRQTSRIIKSNTKNRDDNNTLILCKHVIELRTNKIKCPKCKITQSLTNNLKCSICGSILVTKITP